jgi:hypothetical protein
MYPPGRATRALPRVAGPQREAILVPARHAVHRPSAGAYAAGIALERHMSAVRICTPLLVSALLVSALPAVAQETGGVRITPEARASAVGLARPLPSVQAVTYWPLNLPGYWQRPSAFFNQRPFVRGRWIRAWRSSLWLRAPASSWRH